MDSVSQADAIHAIETALAALRPSHRGGPHRRGPWGDGPPPWAGGHGHPGGESREHGVGGGARIRLLDVLTRAQPDARNGISEIADAIGVDQPRASRLVNDAAMRGLVTRGVDPTDARRSVVAITDAGRALLQQARASRHSAVVGALEGFTADETDQFAALLTRFAAAYSVG